MDDYENEQLNNNVSNESNFEKQIRRSVNLEHQLPGKSTYLDKHHRQIVVAYWLEGDRGIKELTYKDFSSNSLGFDNKTVSSNNNFLEEIGILEKGSKASNYKLTDEGILLAEAFKYKKEDSAKKILSGIIKETWIYESIYKLFGLKEFVYMDDIINELAYASKADLEIHKTRLMPIVDYLEFTKLIKVDSENNQVEFNIISDEVTDNKNSLIEDNSSSSNLPDNKSISNTIETVNEGTSIEVIKKSNATNFKVDTSSSPANINVDISINLEITSEMTPEEIKGKLDAIVSSFNDKE